MRLTAVVDLLAGMPVSSKLVEHDEPARCGLVLVIEVVEFGRGQDLGFGVEGNVVPKP